MGFGIFRPIRKMLVFSQRSQIEKKCGNPHELYFKQNLCLRMKMATGSAYSGLGIFYPIGKVLVLFALAQESYHPVLVLKRPFSE